MGLTALFSRDDSLPRCAIAPDQGLAEKLEAKHERTVQANLILSLWQALAEGFREDERAHEQARFHSHASEVAARVAALPADRAPGAGLARAMLFILHTCVGERVADLHARIDELAATCHDRDTELNVLKLGTSWQTDELERCRMMINEALRGRDTVLPTVGADGAQPLLSELLAALLHVQRPIPPPQAYEGRRKECRAATEASVPSPSRETPPTSEQGEMAAVRRVLREVLEGTTSAPRLARLIEDKDLARQLADLASEHRHYRGLLQRIGLLPR